MNATCQMQSLEMILTSGAFSFLKLVCKIVVCLYPLLQYYLNSYQNWDTLMLSSKQKRLKTNNLVQRGSLHIHDMSIHNIHTNPRKMKKYLLLKLEHFQLSKSSWHLYLVHVIHASNCTFIGNV
jgi:hypothetical protein